jgi:alcohol dehydrogenase (cytochrome c)
VKRLVPAWAYSLDDSNKEESQALVMDGVIYITAHDKTAAINVVTGREIWKTMISYPPETAMTVCCGIENRGGALYNGKFFRTILDGRVQALDIKTGKEIWNVRSSTTAEGYAMTGAPLVANGVVIVGVAGAEFSSRGYIEGYDAETGNRLWRLYTVPRPGERGAETWPNQAANAAGGSTWTTGSYDPDLDLVYWGTGNRSQGRQSVYGQHSGDPAQERPNGLALSDLTQRSLRLRQRAVRDTGRNQFRREPAQGSDAGCAQRVSLRA